MTRRRKKHPCRCGSGALYRACCQPWHDGDEAPTPVALMRSRYCAYAHGRVDYIIRTTQSTSPLRRDDLGAWRRELREFCRSTRFEGLDILEAAPPGEGVGYVTFRAILKAGARDVSMTERSLFEREHGVWRYVSGEHEA